MHINEYLHVNIWQANACHTTHNTHHRDAQKKTKQKQKSTINDIADDKPEIKGLQKPQMLNVNVLEC